MTAGRQVEVPQQPGEAVGLHRRLRRAVEADVGGAGVGAVPDQDLLAVLGERLGQLAHPGRVLAEAPAGRDAPTGSRRAPMISYASCVPSISAVAIGAPPSRAAVA